MTLNKRVGYHIISDFTADNSKLEEIISDIHKLIELTDNACKSSELTDLTRMTIPGFYAIIIAESHLIAYTTGKGISVDIYTCGGNDEKTKRAYQYMKQNLGSPSFEFYTPRPTTTQSVNGTHILCDLIVKNREGLRHVGDLAPFMPEKKHAAAYYQFPGGGASGVIVYENAYATFHTWPETGLITLDFNGVGAIEIYEHLHNNLRKELGILDIKTAYVPRHLPFRTKFKI